MYAVVFAVLVKFCALIVWWMALWYVCEFGGFALVGFALLECVGAFIICL